ncbi:hemolysin family protein [Deinococcus wulumuqiensis]|uniref:Hemolysin n=1 Tax=Deinococcus wulumuqiensis TaxID=980427 RepID=A0AAV4K6I4_9DEIO|nr:hemolysin family protein [Deinococcus wulumuqiensis]QII21574.1 HlyC/CorC family transporter [Deinococcus wulumuqiensis R12]GGI83769.1 hemolysin [Deinococcus wulumuqiensis]GGP29703.1 hemolysin [Deinococcus wulumuqiensis]
MSALLPVLVILVMVAVNALYVAAEFATVGSRRSRVQEAAENGNRAAVSLLDILKDPKRLDNYVAACQIGITLSSLVAGAYGQAQLTPLLTPYFGAAGQGVAVLLTLVLITALQVVLGELLPKTVALRYPERLALATLVPMQFSQWLFTPLIKLFNGTAFALMRAWKLNADHSHAHVHSPEELEGLYRESAAGGLIDAAERDMLAGVLNVEERVVREIMTPRTRLVTVSQDLRVGEALPRLTASPYSRFPVTGEGDDVVGVVHLRSLYLVAETHPATLVRAVMRQPLVVAEVMSVPDLWRKLREAGRHSAVVVSEYGSVSGMVTLEDALEEIFGEMQDEFDHEEDPIVVQGSRVAVRGDVLVEALNARFDLDYPTDEVDTMSGLVWNALGRLPLIGDEVQLGDNPVLRVEAMEKRAVTRVGLTLPRGEA